MISTRWYCGLLLDLPESRRRRLSMQLRRCIRNGVMPSRRAWKATVTEALYGGHTPFG